MHIWMMVRPVLSRLVRFLHISLIEARSERHSSYLGILWSPLSTLIFTGMLALVFSHSQLSVREFYPYVLAGYVLWGFIASTITSSTTVIQKRFDFAIHNQLTLAGLFYKLLIDRLFSFGLDLMLVIGVVLILHPESIGPHLLLLPILLAILSVVSIAVSYTVNLLVILFPDLDAIIAVGVRFMFFVSPIFWGADGASGGVRSLLIVFNPIAYYLSSFRQAFGILPFDPFSWVVTLGLSAIACLVGWVAYHRSSNFVVNLK